MPDQEPLPVTDITVTPEYVSWVVGPVLLTFNLQGHIHAHIVEDLPGTAQAKTALTKYAADLIVAAISAGKAARRPANLRGAILQMQAICATHGVDWDADPNTERLEGLPVSDILKSVEAILA